MIFSTSVRRYLLATMVAISAPALGTLGYLGFIAISDLRTNHRLAGLVEADRALLISGNAIRSDRGKVQTSLQAEDDAAATIRTVLATGQSQVASAVARLTAADLPGQAGLVQAITQAQKAMEARIGDLNAEAAKPKAQRSLAATMPWYDAVGEIEAALTKASAAASLAVRREDPVLAELQAIKAAGWQMRSSYGLQCSVLRPALGSGQALTPAQMQRFGELRGASTSAQSTLAGLVASPGMPASVAAKVTTANQQVTAANQAMDQLVAKLGAGGGPVIAAQDWTSLCNGPFTAIVAAVTGSLDEMLATTAEQSSQAMTRLALIGALLLALIGLCLLSWRGVRKRLANPLVAMNAALARMQAGDVDHPVPAAPCPDEVGALSSALEAYRENLSRVQMLEEQERAAAERRLARAQSVDAIVSDVTDIVAAAAAGDFSARLQIGDADPQMQKLVAGINEINAVVDSATTEFARSLQAVAGGDLT
ncbi:hypothetical protein ASG72_05600, partial [Bosea sp. Leaf344]|uniref:HAMP domain-containing protein n=1 Tax=Bosea sp. Leaf344 TaxID=1736346 RepID=UPI0006F743C6